MSRADRIEIGVFAAVGVAILALWREVFLRGRWPERYR